MTIHQAAQIMGKKGGKAGTGKAKARPITSEQARHAVSVRWANYRNKQAKLTNK